MSSGLVNETPSLPWSNETEKLFEKDLTTKFNIDSRHISAQVIAHSTNKVNNKHIVTLKIVAPRIILAEINTHRVRSLSCSSSRAIPAYKLRKAVWDNPFVPVYFGKNKSGMQAIVQLEGTQLTTARFMWKAASKAAVFFHWLMEKANVHKQTCNRILEPWLSVTATLTMTEFDNFFKLRYSEFAQPEFICLAKAIYDAIKASTPTILETNECHLPWIDQADRDALGNDIVKLIKVSTARSCRSSYANMLGKKSEPQQDLKLYDTLLGNGHLSPFEHIAFVPNQGRISKELHANLQRNFRGWYQFRAFVDPADNQKYLQKFYNINLNE